MQVYKDCCKNCLLSPNSIVSAKRRKEILSYCIRNQSHFICHKATQEGKDVCCKTFFDTMGNVSQLVRIAKILNAVVFVDQKEHEELPTFKQTTP